MKFESLSFFSIEDTLGKLVNLNQEPSCGDCKDGCGGGGTCGNCDKIGCSGS